jgi:hypothetical protein
MTSRGHQALVLALLVWGTLAFLVVVLFRMSAIRTLRRRHRRDRPLTHSWR